MNDKSAQDWDEQIAAALGQVTEQKEKDRYANMRLDRNPFPIASISSPEYASNLPPIRDEHLKTVLDLIRTSAVGKRYSGMSVIGDYGFGKTHLLRWFEHTVNTGSKGKLNAIYVRDPGSSSRELLFAIVRAIGDESLRKMIWAIVQKAIGLGVLAKGLSFFRQFSGGLMPGQALLDTGNEDKCAELASETSVSNYREFIRVFDTLRLSREKLRDYIDATLRPHVTNLAVSSQFASFIANPEEEAYRSWMALVSGSPRDLQVLQDDYFKAILAVLKANGFQHTYLLLDEFEDVAIVRLTSRKTLEYAAELRMLIDTNLTEFSLVLAMTNEGFESLASTYPPLTERLNFKIDLSPLSALEVESLILRYLKQSRIQGVSQDSLSPFSKTVVKRITEVSKGNPRTIISLCYRLIEACGDQRASNITTNMVSELQPP